MSWLQHELMLGLGLGLGQGLAPGTWAYVWANELQLFYFLALNWRPLHAAWPEPKAPFLIGATTTVPHCKNSRLLPAAFMLITTHA